MMQKLVNYLKMEETNVKVLLEKGMDSEIGEYVYEIDDNGIYIMDIMTSINHYTMLPYDRESFIEHCMNNIVRTLTTASDAYYNGKEIMTNYDYDQLYDALKKIESETSIILPESPTQTVGAAVVSELPKFTHSHPALSLDKTKDINEYVDNFKKHIANVSNKDIILMYKEDGGTVQAYYENGSLKNLVTRGNGEIGSDITHNAKHIKGLPMNISYNGKLIVRGEAVMSYIEFDRINSTLPEEEKYKNPRNLANATISLLDSNEMAEREIWFQGFNLVYIEDENYISSSYDGSGMLKKSFHARLNCMSDLGFNTVKRWVTDSSNLESVMNIATDSVASYEFPVDGLVACMDDYSYTVELTGTGHHPHIMSGYAFKWADETMVTTLEAIEWSASRTGLLNPVAVFKPVELCGTTVTRASLHNVSYIMDMDLIVGDEIEVYKANMIIPQIARNITGENRDKKVKIMQDYTITRCPVCGEILSYQTNEDSDTTVLKCLNPLCSAKMIGKFVHFAERDCCNIMGLSENKISDLINFGLLSGFDSFYKITKAYFYNNGHLFDRNMIDIASLDGWGEKAVKNLVDSIETALNNLNFISVMHSFGIENVGKGQSKLLKKAVENYHLSNPSDNDEDYFKCLARMQWEGYDFTSIEGFGEVIALSLSKWIDLNLIDPWCRHTVDNEISRFLDKVHLADKWPENNNEKLPLEGMTFVITGSLVNYPNRDALVTEIEHLGGKVSGSVSKNTNYLINNDVTSTSGKNKKAKDLGVMIISEQELIAMYLK